MNYKETLESVDSLLLEILCNPETSEEKFRQCLKVRDGLKNLLCSYVKGDKEKELLDAANTEQLIGSWQENCQITKPPILYKNERG